MPYLVSTPSCLCVPVLVVFHLYYLWWRRFRNVWLRFSLLYREEIKAKCINIKIYCRYLLTSTYNLVDIFFFIPDFFMDPCTVHPSSYITHFIPCFFCWFSCFLAFCMFCCYDMAQVLYLSTALISEDSQALVIRPNKSFLLVLSGNRSRMP